jgi:hypothetical protein
MFISPSVIKNIAKDELSISSSGNKYAWNRKFRGFFGVSPKVVARLWNTLYFQKKIPDGGMVIHLLWTMAFLKLYDTESIYLTMFAVTDKTFRKWVWKFLDSIHTIKLVSTYSY